MELAPPSSSSLHSVCSTHFLPPSPPPSPPMLCTTNPNRANSPPSLSSDQALPLLLPRHPPSPPLLTSPPHLARLLSFCSFSFCLLPPFFPSSPPSLSALPINCGSLRVAEVMSCEISCGVFVCFWRRQRTREGKWRVGFSTGNQTGRVTMASLD